MIPAFGAYLFDVDGTLIDSAPDICAVQREILSGTPAPPPPDDVLKRYIGRHLIELYGDLLPGYSPAAIGELVESYRAMYRARNHQLTRLFPGVAETLARLPGRKSTATTKGTETTGLLLDHFGIAVHFDHVQGTDGFPHKPAPDVILRALAGLGVSAAECLMVGDTPADMQAGRRAGVRLCAVCYGYGDPAELARYEPDYWIDRFDELLPE